MLEYETRDKNVCVDRENDKHRSEIPLRSMDVYVCATRHHAARIRKNRSKYCGFCDENRELIRQVRNSPSSQTPINDHERFKRYMVGESNIHDDRRTALVPFGVVRARNKLGPPSGVLAMLQSYRCEQGSVPIGKHGRITGLPLMAFKVLNPFFGDLVKSSRFTKSFNETFVVHFPEIPFHRFLAKRDVLAFKVKVDVRRLKRNVPVLGHEVKDTELSRFFRHWFESRINHTYRHRKIVFELIVSHLYGISSMRTRSGTTFIMESLYGNITTANRSQGATEGSDQNGPEWDRVCGRADPMKEQHDRGCNITEHSQNVIGTNYEQRGLSEVAAA